MTKPTTIDFPESMSPREWEWEEPEDGLAAHEVSSAIEDAIKPVMEKLEAHYSGLESRIFKTIMDQFRRDLMDRGLSAQYGDGWFVDLLFFEECYAHFRSVDLISEIAKACSENAEDPACKEAIASCLEASAKIIRDSM